MSEPAKDEDKLGEQACVALNTIAKWEKERNNG